jgi:hypothetical protein
MTASRRPTEALPLVSKVIDCEPAPVGVAACRSAPALRKRVPRPQHRITHPTATDIAPPRDAVVFADAALRRVLEVIDRRRPVAQLQHLLAPTVIETVIALSRAPHAAAARMHRIRVRTAAADRDQVAAEVFGTYTRGARVLAVAARIEHTANRWRVVALQLG